MEKESKVLLEAIDKAYQDSGVRIDPELSQILLRSARQLEKTDNYHHVSADLNQKLQFWGMGHNHGPKVIDDLYQATIDNTHGLANQKIATGLD